MFSQGNKVSEICDNPVNPNSNMKSHETFRRIIQNPNDEDEYKEDPQSVI